MGKMSREKGKRGERELAKKLREYGYDCRRGQQFCGANGDADVIGLPGIHIEVKRTERLSIYDAMDQAKRDKKIGEIPVVMHRKNNCEWLAILRLEDFMKQYRLVQRWRCCQRRTCAVLHRKKWRYALWDCFQIRNDLSEDRSAKWDR